jgi:hypothetical protein
MLMYRRPYKDAGAFMSLEHSPARAGEGDVRLSHLEDLADFTIAEWCALRRLSRSMYYKLKKLGLGPEVTFYGGTIPRITREADRSWRETAPRRSTRLLRAEASPQTPADTPT